MAEYRLSPAAELDLENIWLYSRDEWGVAQANRYIDILVAGFQDLSRNPQAAKPCEHIRPGYRCRSVERHVVYFRLINDGIVIMRILHGRMDASRHL